MTGQELYNSLPIKIYSCKQKYQFIGKRVSIMKPVVLSSTQIRNILYNILSYNLLLCSFIFF